MYLLELNNFTGLIQNDPELDGWNAIESFRILVNKKGYGLEALTCVALVIDYGSMIKNYSEKERPLKAMEIVFNNRKALNWNCDEIQLACINYKELQYNPALEEKTLLDELRISKLNEIKEADNTFKKTVLLKELSNINDLHDSFDKKNGAKDTFAESPVRNGYSLLRLEVKILDPKSFYYEKQRRATEAKERELEESRKKESGNNTSTESTKRGTTASATADSSSATSATANRGKNIIPPPPIGIPKPPISSKSTNG